MLLTYRDIIDHMIDVFNLDGKDVNDVSRKVRRAVKEAVNTLHASHNWEYFLRTGMITSTVPYQTGTVAYNSTTRQFTLTGGVWPADAEFGSVLINKSRFEVQRRVSDTVIEMDPQQAPAANIASGSSYQWIRQRYLLPFDVSDIKEITDSRLLSTMARTSPEDNFWRSEAWYTNGSPSTWCMVQSRRRPGRWEVWLGAAPVDVRQYRYLYQLRWGANEVEEISSGTVSVSGDVATFSSGVLTESCVGSVLRISSGADKPTNTIGRYDRTNLDTIVNILNPAQYERIIQEVTNSTTAVLSESIPAGVTSKAYTVSTFIDVNREGMEDYLFRLAEFKFLQISRADGDAIGLADRNRHNAMIIAMNADARNMQSNLMRPYYPRPIIQENG